jgi:hypothetical protein
MTSDKTLIILDTNILTDGNNSSPDYSIFVSNSRFKEFLSFLEKHKIKDKVIFGIPRTVFEEHYFHKNNNFNKDFLNLKEKVSQFNKMELLENGELNLSFDDTFDYKDYLTNLIKDNENFVLLEVDEEKKRNLFEKVLEDSINHKGQFENKTDRNFKDAVIWESICCQDFEEYAWVILFHQNPGDFPDNSNVKEINRAGKNTGEIIHVLTKYDDVKKDLEKVYMFVEKEIKSYILEYFKSRIEENAGEYIDCILENFNLIPETIKIEKLKPSNLEDIQMLEDWGNKENIWVINFKFKADCIDDDGKESREFLGEIYFDNDVKEILWSRYDKA